MHYALWADLPIFQVIIHAGNNKNNKKNNKAGKTVLTQFENQHEKQTNRQEEGGKERRQEEGVDRALNVNPVCIKSDARVGST